MGNKEENEKTKEDILQNQALENALNASIENLTMMLDFDREIGPDDYLGEGLLIRMQHSNSVQARQLQALYTILKGENPEGTTWFFQHLSLTTKEYRTKIRTGGGFNYYPNKLQSIPLPITLKNSRNKPFIGVRDLNEADIDFFLPAKLAERLQRIRVFVNPGSRYQTFLLVFDQPVTSDSWEVTDYCLNDNFEQEIKHELPYVKNPGDYQSKWKIDLTKASLKINQPAQPVDTRLPYYHFRILPLTTTLGTCGN